jgi:hypothetical protein
MKSNKYLLLAMALFTLGSTQGQDTMTLVNKEIILCKVKTINRNDVDYVLWTSQSGPIYGVSKAMIHRIQYETGGDLMLNPLPVEEQRTQVRDSSTKETQMQGTYIQ